MVVSGEITVAASSYWSTRTAVSLRIMIDFLDSRIFMQGLTEIVLTGIDDEIIVPEGRRFIAALVQNGLHGGDAFILHQFFHCQQFSGGSASHAPRLFKHSTAHAVFGYRPDKHVIVPAGCDKSKMLAGRFIV